MKTSILVSSIAAICLMLTFAESPKRDSAEYSHTSLVSNYSYGHSTMVITLPEVTITAAKIAKPEIKPAYPSLENFNYLKFDVARYQNNDETASELNVENSPEHLRFDVTEYTGNTEVTSFDAIELPVNEFANLKFDVTEYTANTELTSFDAIELPVNEFAKLKFDVTEYTKNTEMTSPDAIELPVDEFAKLKFDVNKYSAQNNLNSDNFGEMPKN